MKILNVNHLIDPLTGGGTAERIFQISRFLSKAGASCTLLTLDFGVTPERIDALEGTQVVALPCLNRRYLIPRVSIAEINRLVGEADIVHLTGHWTLLNALVYKSCRTLNTPFVFCPAGALKLFGRSLFLKRLYNQWVGVDIARSALACVAITEDECADFLDYAVPRDQVVVIPNGIDPDEYSHPSMVDHAAARAKYSLSAAPYILFLGRLSEIKGPDLLLSAFADVADRLNGFHLVFAGPDGGMLQKLKKMSETPLLAGRVHFTGYIGGEDKAAILRGARLLAIPSRHEAMSIVVLEAGICATPVLFTNSCGLDNLEREGAGVMVDASRDGLAGGLFEALSNEQEAIFRANRLSEIVRERYLWQIQADRYMALYSKLLTRRSL